MKRIDKYVFEEKDLLLQRNKYTKVYRGRNINTNQYILLNKIDQTRISQTAAHLEAMMSEIRKSKRLNSSSILQIIETVETSHNFYLIYEYGEKTLRDYLNQKQRLSQSEVIKIMIDIVRSLVEIRLTGVFNIELRPESIWMCGGKFQAGDLGFDREIFMDQFRLSDRFRSDFSQQLCYLSPETLEFISETSVDQASDIWNIGVLAYEMVFGVLPWSGEYDWELRENMKNLECTYDYPGIPEISENLENFLRKCLIKKSGERITWNMLLLHDIFGGYFVRNFKLEPVATENQNLTCTTENNYEQTNGSKNQQILNKNQVIKQQQQQPFENLLGNPNNEIYQNNGNNIHKHYQNQNYYAQTPQVLNPYNKEGWDHSENVNSQKSVEKRTPAKEERMVEEKISSFQNVYKFDGNSPRQIDRLQNLGDIAYRNNTIGDSISRQSAEKIINSVNNYKNGESNNAKTPQQNHSKLPVPDLWNMPMSSSAERGRLAHQENQKEQYMGEQLIQPGLSSKGSDYHSRQNANKNILIGNLLRTHAPNPLDQLRNSTSSLSASHFPPASYPHSQVESIQNNPSFNQNLNSRSESAHKTITETNQTMLESKQNSLNASGRNSGQILTFEEIQNGVLLNDFEGQFADNTGLQSNNQPNYASGSHNNNGSILFDTFETLQKIDPYRNSNRLHKNNEKILNHMNGSLYSNPQAFVPDSKKLHTVETPENFMKRDFSKSVDQYSKFYDNFDSSTKQPQSNSRFRSASKNDGKTTSSLNIRVNQSYNLGNCGISQFQGIEPNQLKDIQISIADNLSHINNMIKSTKALIAPNPTSTNTSSSNLPPRNSIVNKKFQTIPYLANHAVEEIKANYQKLLEPAQYTHYNIIKEENSNKNTQQQQQQQHREPQNNNSIDFSNNESTDRQNIVKNNSPKRVPDSNEQPKNQFSNVNDDRFMNFSLNPNYVNIAQQSSHQEKTQINYVTSVQPSNNPFNNIYPNTLQSNINTVNVQNSNGERGVGVNMSNQVIEHINYSPSENQLKNSYNGPKINESPNPNVPGETQALNSTNVQSTSASRILNQNIVKVVVCPVPQSNPQQHQQIQHNLKSNQIQQQLPQTQTPLQHQVVAQNSPKRVKTSDASEIHQNYVILNHPNHSQIPHVQNLQQHHHQHQHQQQQQHQQIPTMFQQFKSPQMGGGPNNTSPPKNINISPRKVKIYHPNNQAQINNNNGLLHQSRIGQNFRASVNNYTVKQELNYAQPYQLIPTENDQVIYSDKKIIQNTNHYEFEKLALYQHNQQREDIPNIPNIPTNAANLRAVRVQRGISLVKNQTIDVSESVYQTPSKVVSRPFSVDQVKQNVIGNYDGHAQVSRATANILNISQQCQSSEFIKTPQKTIIGQRTVPKFQFMNIGEQIERSGSRPRR